VVAVATETAVATAMEAALVADTAVGTAIVADLVSGAAVATAMAAGPGSWRGSGHSNGGRTWWLARRWPQQ
jgi:hypothetical protein